MYIHCGALTAHRDAWKQQNNLSRTEAKRRYITTLIDTMHQYASPSPDSRELVAELEFVWDQVKSNVPSSSSSSPLQTLDQAPGMSASYSALERQRATKDRDSYSHHDDDGDDDDDRPLQIKSPMSQSEEDLEAEEAELEREEEESSTRRTRSTRWNSTARAPWTTISAKQTHSPPHGCRDRSRSPSAQHNHGRYRDAI
jgi:hypothetical protein